MDAAAPTLLPIDADGPPRRLGPGTTEHIVTTASGRQVVVWRTEPLLDGARHAHPVIVAPGFARPMADMAGVALGLAVNGLTTYRFDPLDHVGLSDGDIRRFTMSGGVESTEAVAAFVRADSGADPSYLATSLSARYVLRHLAGRADVHTAVLAVGVVNAWQTLRLVFGRDFASGGLDGLPPLVSFDGEDIDPVHLWRDDLQNDWGSLSGTLADLSTVTAPLTGIYATDDPWVDITDVRMAFAGREGLRLLELPTDDHDLFSNPAHGVTAMTAATAALVGLPVSTTTLVPVPGPVIRQAVQLERAALDAGRELAAAGSNR